MVLSIRSRFFNQTCLSAGMPAASADVQRHAGGIVHFICWTKRRERRHRRRVSE
jgi:hypothetical protein